MKQENHHRPQPMLPSNSFTKLTDAGHPMSNVAKQVVELLPAHETYVEPHADFGTLLGVKPESRNEVVNDTNGDLLHLYTTVKDEQAELVRFLAESPLDLSLRRELGQTFLRGFRHADDIVRAAQYFLQFAEPRTVTGSVNDDPEPIAELLKKFKGRFDGVLLESKPPHEVMEAYEDESVCQFINPPYDTSRYEYANRSLDLRIMESLMEWQGGGLGGEPYWALLTTSSPSPLAMLPTTALGDLTLTRNFDLNLSYVTQFVEQAAPARNGNLTLFSTQQEVV